MSQKITPSQPTDENPTEKLAELIKGIRIAMVTTYDQNGELNTRPMYAQQTDADGSLWFATSKSSTLVEEIRDRSRIFVTFAQPDDQRFIVVRGEGYLRHDRTKIDELWNPAMKAWFPAGPSDPDIALIRVVAHEAEYWDSPSTPVRWLRFVTALATGTKPSGGTHASLDLRTSLEGEG